MPLEAAAMGTLSVAFDVGECRDIIHDGETGKLATLADTNSFADCIVSVLSASDSEKAQYSFNCRNMAENDYAIDKQSENYESLYIDLTEKC